MSRCFDIDFKIVSPKKETGHRSFYGEGPMAGSGNLSANASESARDSPSPDRPSHRRADSNSNNSDGCNGG
jgi:hypothetical protein